MKAYCCSVALAAGVTGPGGRSAAAQRRPRRLLESRTVRVLVPYSRTLFFNDKRRAARADRRYAA